MLSCELQKRQWAIPAEPEIFSQIVICLFCMRISAISRPSICKTSYDGELWDYIELIKKLIKNIIVLLSSKVNVEQSFTTVQELHSGKKSLGS